MPLRKTSADEAPTNAALVRATEKQTSGRCARAVASGKASADQPEEQIGRGDPLCLVAGGRKPDARFISDGRIELDNNTVERSIRPIAMHESLCTPSSSVCKHWNRVGVDNATRATLPGHRRFDRLRRQVVRTDLMRCAGNDLHSRKHTGFDKATYRVVCDA